MRFPLRHIIIIVIIIESRDLKQFYRLSLMTLKCILLLCGVYMRVKWQKIAPEINWF
jgi:hypothetical protein